MNIFSKNKLLLSYYIKGFVRGLGIFLVLVIMMSLSKALDITTNVQQKVTYIKKMYFTSDGISPDETFSNVNITIDGEDGSIVTSGAININPGKLKNNTIMSEDIKNLTIKSNNIGNSAIIGTKIVADSITNTKIANLGVKTQDIKDNSLGAVHLDSTKDYTFQKLIDADNENYYIDPVGASSVNRIEGNSLYTDKAMKISTKLGIGKDPVEELDVNGGIKGTGQVCGKYSGIYGTISKYCIGDQPLEIGTLQTNKWCKVSGNRINCTYDVPFTFSWKIGEYGSCNKSCGGGVQTRPVDCERNDEKLVADSYCNTTKPASTLSCNTNPCITYAWSVGTWGTCSGGTWGAWGACSKTCGGGLQYRGCNSSTGNQTRSVVCKSSLGATVSDSYCSGAKPVLSQSCTSSNCVGSTSQACNTQNCITKKKILFYFNGGSGFQHESRCVYYKNVPTSGSFTQRQEKNLSLSYTTDHYDKVVNTGAPFLDLRVDPYPKTITSSTINGCWFEDHGRYSTNKPKIKSFNPRSYYTPYCSISMEGGLMKLCLSGANPGADRYVWEVDITYQ